MDRWVAALMLAGCGPSVGIVESTSDTAAGDDTSTTGRTATSSAPDDSTGQTTGTSLPDASTSMAGDTTGSSTCDPDADADDGEDTADLGECDPDIDGPYGHLWIEDADGDDQELIDIDAVCMVTNVTVREPTQTSIGVSCPSNEVVLELLADPPVTLVPELAAGQSIQLRAFRDFYIDSAAPHHVVVRDMEDGIIAAYRGYQDVPENEYPDYLEWFAPITASDVDLECQVVEDPPPPTICGGFIEVPCPTADERRSVAFDDGVNQIQVDAADVGVLGNLELRARATRYHPPGGPGCGDTPYTRMTWTAFRVQ